MPTDRKSSGWQSEHKSGLEQVATSSSQPRALTSPDVNTPTGLLPLSSLNLVDLDFKRPTMSDGAPKVAVDEEAIAETKLHITMPEPGNAPPQSREYYCLLQFLAVLTTVRQRFRSRLGHLSLHLTNFGATLSPYFG